MRVAISVLSATAALASPKPAKVEPPPAATALPATATKVVQVGDHDVIPVQTRLRFTTMIVLPKEETILDFVCGDKEFWVVNGSQNFAFVKPAKENSQTNLNLITASGNVYSFTLTEAGETSTPDLKVFAEPKGEGLLASIQGQPRFVAAASIDDYRRQLEMARDAAAKARTEADEAIASAKKQSATEIAMARAGFPASLQFDYHYTDQVGVPSGGDLPRRQVHLHPRQSAGNARAV